ncbi:YbaB/EbfC family nucleoid-associated protein [Micromonospora sp. NBC_01813]|uniref:YbaB/EbfC family nucleoid-associated protein n=1 Tax=Micromonospora sp. NBC_01813 TaxID=2975988 RepID=UPI002DD9BC27|nr:YbaB/EbfC family nucleoid-associated protein [Micromonospora sp. NBC_01813]WSA10332.1 YbaB/EbfC family nucleoid-associated protein [Micromonospora sp. NBC_01813]
MTSAWESQIQQGLTEVRRYQEDLGRMQRSMQERSASVTTADRAMTVVVGAQGELKELTFLGQAYRTMAPTDLAKAIVGAYQQARSQMAAETEEAVRAFVERGTQIRARMTGDNPLEDLLAPIRDEARRVGRVD